MLKPLSLWITTNCWKFLKRWEYETNLPASCEACMQVKKQKIRTRHGRMDWFGKEYSKAVYCHPACLISMQSTSCKMMAWEKHKLESRLPGEISITSDMLMIPPLWQKLRETKESLDKGKRGEWKSWLKTQHSENEDHGIQSHYFMERRWETMETATDYFLGLQNHWDGDCSHEIKRCSLLGRKAMTNLDSILKIRDITLPRKVIQSKLWFFQ